MSSIEIGDDLPPGILKTVKVLIDPYFIETNRLSFGHIKLRGYQKNITCYNYFAQTNRA